MRIDEWKVKLFPVLLKPLTVLSGATVDPKPRGGASVDIRGPTATTPAVSEPREDEGDQNSDGSSSAQEAPHVDQVYIHPEEQKSNPDEDVPFNIWSSLPVAPALAVVVACLCLCNVVEAWRLAKQGLLQT